MKGSNYPVCVEGVWLRSTGDAFILVLKVPAARCVRRVRFVICSLTYSALITNSAPSCITGDTVYLLPCLLNNNLATSFKQWALWRVKRVSYFYGAAKDFLT